MIPGDPEREMTAYREEHGIPVKPKVVEELETLAARFELKGLATYEKCLKQTKLAQAEPCPDNQRAVVR